MTIPDLDPDILKRLQQAADGEQCDPSELLARLLDDHQQPSADQRLLLDQVSDAIIITDRDLVITSWNKSAEHIYLWNEEEAIGQHIDVLLKTEWIFETQEEAREKLVAYGIWNGAIRQQTRGGDTRLISATVNWLRNTADEIIGGIAVMHDITLYSQMQESVLQREEQYRQLVENSHQGIIISQDNPLRISFASQPMTRITGYTPDEILQMGPAELVQTVHPEDRERFFRNFQKRLDGEELANHQRYRLIHRSGDIRWVDIYSTLINYRGEPALQTAFLDITEQLESEEQYRQLVEHSHQGILITQVKPMQIRFANAPMAAMSGYSVEELVEMSSETLLAHFHEDDLERFLNRVVQRIRGKDIGTKHRYRLYHRNGKLRWIDLYSSFIMYRGEAAIQTAVLDVTEQVEAEAALQEYERLQNRFQQEQTQVELIERTLSSLSHDLRTPFSVIISATETMRLYADRLPAEKRAKKLNTIGHQIQVALEILDDSLVAIRGSLKPDNFTPRAINLDDLCKLTVTGISDAGHSKHRLEYRNLADVQIAVVDETLVTRILLNLITNAIKYSAEGTLVLLELDRDVNKNIILRVHDEGIGITPLDLPHIFDPFFRSNQVASINGTGLGLSIVRDCVDRHRGQISVTSTPHQGTTFTITLPEATSNHRTPCSGGVSSI